MKVDKHNLKMVGLREAAGETKGLRGYFSGEYVQISYDRDDGEILTNYHYSLGQNSWSDYHCESIITVCFASDPMTMQEIADAIYDAVEDYEWRQSVGY